MGGGSSDHTKEHLLIVLPFAEPKAVIERIEKKHPDLKVTYKELYYADTPWKAEDEVPEGGSSAP